MVVLRHVQKWRRGDIQVRGYLHDGLGSVVALTNGSGSVANSYAYDPYGNTTSSTGTVANPFRFIGAVWDSSTGLYKMGERYYDPSVGRFTQEDPLGDEYQYVGDNPINAVDPSGLCEAEEGDCPPGEASITGVENAGSWSYETEGSGSENDEESYREVDTISAEGAKMNVTNCKGIPRGLRTGSTKCTQKREGPTLVIRKLGNSSKTGRRPGNQGHREETSIEGDEWRG